jgi:hypothetical protein
MDSSLIISDQKIKSKIKTLIDYSMYMVDKRLRTINREMQIMKTEFYENLLKGNF